MLFCFFVDMIYLNTAFTGLISTASLNASNAFQEKHSMLGSLEIEHAYFNIPKISRSLISRLLQCSPEQIALIPNFSFGINSIVSTVKSYKKRVLLFKDDYPSLNLPFDIHKFDITYIKEISTDNIISMASKNEVEIIAVSHIQWLDGQRIDLKKLSEFCAQHDILLIIDATQSVGALDIDLSELKVDVLITSSYKWLNAGLGSGFMYLSQQFIDKFEPSIGGYHSFSGTPPIYQPSIRSYEPGHLNLNGLVMLNEALNFKITKGIKEIENHVFQLTSKIRANGICKHQDLPSNIVAIESTQKIFDHLKSKDIAVTFRNGYLRVSPHFHNTYEEIDFFLESYESLMK